MKTPIHYLLWLLCVYLLVVGTMVAAKAQTGNLQNRVPVLPIEHADHIHQSK